MAEIIESEKKIIIKIVYYGPAMSGKTTNLMHLHEVMTPSRRGELMALETKGDRTLFFDLLPMMVKSRGDFRIKYKVFTVPGQVAHDATRKAVLSRADGVVFVADSQTAQSVNNAESFENLEKNCARVGLDFDRLPLVVQFNKRDLPGIVSREEIIERWAGSGLSITLSSAIQGRGVVKTFSKIISLVYLQLDRQYAIGKKYRIQEREMFSFVS